jgi:hypothetical protein
MFRQLRAQFGGTRAAGAGLELVDAPCGPTKHCRRRDVAWCLPAKRTVYLLRRALQFSRAQLEGLVLHELGHIADPIVEHPHREKRADAIAHAVTGRRIRYGAHDIQTTGRGRLTRPAYLHQ